MAKTIELLLYDGTLNGVMFIKDSGWNSGELYSAPRKSIDELISKTSNKYGVYLLLSKESVYIGQSSDLSKRIKNHNYRKDWWERAIILTTSDNNLDRSDIDYLEAALIEKAKANNKLHCDNKKKGNPKKVSEFKKIKLDTYLEEAFLLMELIGVTVFCKVNNIMKKMPEIESVDYNGDVKNKKDAKELLEKHGIIINKFSYAKKQDKKPVYWLNPKITVVDDDWDLVLNNNKKCELIYIHVPEKTFTIREKNKNKNGFYTRPDRERDIDLNINVETLCDTRSNNDFSPYIVKKLKYSTK